MEGAVVEEGLGRRTGRSERESECGEAQCSRGFRHCNGTEQNGTERSQLTTTRYVSDFFFFIIKIGFDYSFIH